MRPHPRLRTEAYILFTHSPSDTGEECTSIANKLYPLVGGIYNPRTQGYTLRLLITNLLLAIEVDPRPDQILLEFGCGHVRMVARELVDCQSNDKLIPTIHLCYLHLLL